MKNVSIKISGNLLSESLLDTLSQENSKHKFAQPESFKWYKYDIIDSKSIHFTRIAEAYDNLKARWDLLSSDFPEMDISTYRDKWVRYFFSQFGYDLQYQKADIEAESGIKYHLSHRGWNGDHAPVVHTVLYSQGLDDKPEKGRHRYSPHDTLQRYLNQTKAVLWGIVTNGKNLRILRDFHHETRKAYVDIDLETIFDGRNYSDFRMLWRLIHPSRFIPDEDNKCLLELLFEQSKEAGVAIGENLQKNICLAIEALGNGFLAGTPELIDKLVDNTENSRKFYQQIMRVIYRMLFLLYAEQRNLMPVHTSLYAQEYSMSSLREQVEVNQDYDAEQYDLWEGLKATFIMVYKGVPELGIPSFNGQLFNPDTIPWLRKSQCRNDKLLEAVRYISLFEKQGVLHRISYIELDVDEIGSIYESLLEYIPRVLSKQEEIEESKKNKSRSKSRTIPAKTFFLDPRGTSRKTTGTYYTHPGLVNALIESALKPVLEDKLKQAGQKKEEQEKALLALKVCDPACGSAAFLIAATEYLGEQLAKIRIQDDYPDDFILRHARRDVLRHCIYGVDINPMAVELAKVSLWLAAATNDQPLNFLDHRIKCGNSLIGATPELIEKGIPPEAYTPVEGENKETAKSRMKTAREYLKRKEKHEVKYKDQLSLGSISKQSKLQVLKIRDLSEEYDENTPVETEEIEKDYKKIREDKDFKRNKLLADYWVSAFFWEHKDKGDDYPKQEVLEYLLKDDKTDINENLKKKIDALAEEYQFFHWHLEFPEVFVHGGFDCVLGNPPWELQQLQEQEFFYIYNSEIAELSGIQRKKQLEKLQYNDPKLYNIFILKKNKIKKQNIFFTKSGNNILTSRGKINSYSVFVELFFKKCNDIARLGFIIPSAIGTNESNKNFIEYLIKKNLLASFIGFTNRGYLFKDTESTFSFSLITLSKVPVQKIKFASQIWQVEDINEKRCYNLNSNDLILLNPNTFNLPVFTSVRSANIILQIYKENLILDNEQTKMKSWNYQFKQGLFNMTSDSSLFKKTNDFKDIENLKKTNKIVLKNKVYLPLYESKLIAQYNHRSATFEGIPFNEVYGTRPKTIKASNVHLMNKNWHIVPRYWVLDVDVENKIPEFWKYKWLIGFRNAVSAVADSRSGIATVLPRVGVGNSMPLIFLRHSIKECCLFLANFNSFILDYIIKQKVSGSNLNFYIVKQFPFITLKNYSSQLKEYIPKVILKLIFTAYDLKPFAEDLGYTGEPFTWNEEERLILKSELDAIYAHLYRISKEDLDYILETFPIVKRKDMEKYKEFRTKKLILEKYEEFKSKF